MLAKYLFMVCQYFKLHTKLMSTRASVSQGGNPLGQKEPRVELLKLLS